MWGSTDTLHPRLDEAEQASARDVQYLIDEFNTHFTARLTHDEVVAVRTGVRPVAVPRDAKIDPHHSGLTRHHRLHLDEVRPWLSVYGGKLSGCAGLAAEVRELLSHRLAAPGRVPASAPPTSTLAVPAFYPTLPDAVMPAAWSVTHEHCRGLDDYLRRRTNIAQWVPRGGLGRSHEHVDHLFTVATEIHGGDAARAERDLAAYVRAADAQWHVVQPHSTAADLTLTGAYR